MPFLRVSEALSRSGFPGITPAIVNRPSVSVTIRCIVLIPDRYWEAVSPSADRSSHAHRHCRSWHRLGNSRLIQQAPRDLAPRLDGNRQVAGVVPFDDQVTDELSFLMEDLDAPWLFRSIPPDLHAAEGDGIPIVECLHHAIVPPA
jgi:hypothetical protein